MSGIVQEMMTPDGLAAPQSTAPISTAAVVATVALGCIGLLLLGIQPVVLGALQRAGRLSLPAMGQAAMVETLALGAVSAWMAARIPHQRLRLWGLGGALLLALGNGAGLFASGLAFVLSRALCGVAGGVLVWLATGLITRRQDASRINAIFLGSQAVSQGSVAALIPITVGPSLGANSGLWIIGGAAALALPLLLLVPRQLPELPPEVRNATSLQLSSMSGLAAIVLMMAGIVGLWVYVEPIARTHHIAEGLISLGIAASLAVQVIGAALMVGIGHRIKPVAGLMTTAIAFLVVITAFAWLPSQGVFLAATMALGLIWVVALVLALPLLLAADPARHAPMYSPAAALLGSSLGPFVAGAFATERNIGPALIATAVLFTLAAVAVVVSAVSRRAG
ncbi:hypothetical protein [Phenylobacterium montanum]|uniref:MFS transporter n=1 Tax=Phenylobacterium montanum TaxID=2823693 RepID=A0A975G3Q8_9CAUL|nr:hypothetical protein [Caulobacter sp. S6]QUD90244.1 hypothetical protein KCG34_10460 [Caulobacter sp. S6]